MSTQLLQKRYDKLYSLIEQHIPLTEGLEELTYMHLRLLFVKMSKKAGGELRKIIAEILKIIAILEIRNQPVKTLKKQTSTSLSVFS
jgi:hypothetical protein